MPNIKTYDNPIDILRPQEAGPEAAARAGRIIEGQYNAAGQRIGGAISQVGGEVADAIHQHDVQTEVSTGMDTLLKAKMQTDKEQADINKRLLDPNPEVQAQATKEQAEYNENVLEPRMQAWKDQFKTKEGQRFALDHVSHWEESQQQHQIANQAIISGAQFHQNYVSMTNSSIARASATPSATDETIADYTTNFNMALGTAKGLTTEQIAKAQEERELGVREIVHSAITGAAERGNIEQARGILENPKYADIIGPERHTLDNYLHTTEKMGKAEDDHRVRQASQDAVDTHTSQIYDPDTGRVNYKIAAQEVGKANADPNILEKDRNKVGSFIGQAVRAQRAADADEAGSIHDDPATVLGLMKGIQAGTTTLDSIGKAAVDGKITVGRMSELANSMNKPAADALKKVVSDPIVKTQIGQGEQIIQGNTPTSTITNGLNKAVVEKQAQYKIDLYTKMRDAQLNGQDPRQFVDPKSKTFLDPLLYKPSAQELADEAVKQRPTPIPPFTGTLPAAPGATKPASKVKPPIGSFFNIGGQ